MKKKTVIAITLLVITSLLFIINPIANATINPDEYKPKEPNRSDVDRIIEIANPIIGTIKTVGIVIAVITMAILGVKYMTGSVSEKAEYKKTMMPYLVGAIMVVAITQLLGIIIEIVNGLK